VILFRGPKQPTATLPKKPERNDVKEGMEAWLNPTGDSKKIHFISEGRHWAGACQGKCFFGKKGLVI
jgi:hypothetical protein